MNTDDRLTSYFTARSADIPVHGIGTPAIAARAQRRRHRRNGVKIAAVVGALAVGGIAIARPDHSGQPVASEGEVPARPLDWAVAPSPEAALGASLGAVSSDDGTLYEISTAPGAPTSNVTVGPRHLYRSTDGTTWEGVALPDGFSASGVAASADRIYTVGTSPAGGSGERVSLASGTGDGAWSEVDLPLDLEGMAAVFPGKLNAARNRVAVSGDGSMVVTVSLEARLDPSELALDLGSENYSPTEAGVDIYGDFCEAGSDPEDRTTPTTVAPSGEAPSSPDGPCDPDAYRNVVRSHPWAELGVDPAIGALAVGRTYVFSGPVDGPLVEVAQVPAISWTTEVLGSPDGYWLLYGVNEAAPGNDQPMEATQALHSPDGTTWDQAAAIRLEGVISSAGMVDGRPTAVTRTQVGRPFVHSLTLGGVQSTDVLASAPAPSNHVNATATAIGPLGVALVVADVESPWESTVLTSSDGSTFAAQELPAGPDGIQETVSGISVSADAVTVRLYGYEPNARPGVAPERRLFVGTPR